MCQSQTVSKTVEVDHEYQSEKTNPIDNLFLVFDQEHTPMTMSSIWTFSSVLSYDDVLSANKNFNEKPEYRRYRQLITGDPLSCDSYFSDYADFNIRDHVVEHNFEKEDNNNSDKQVEEFIGALLSKPIPRDKPLWDCHLLTGLKNGGSMLLYRVHHAISDGQGTIRAFLSVSSFEKDLVSQQYNAGKSSPIRKRKSVLFSDKDKPKLSPFSWENIELEYKKISKKISSFYFIICAFIVATWDSLCYVLVPRTVLNKTEPNPEGKKEVAWVKEGLCLEDVKFVKNTFGKSVNDVLLSCTAGAVRQQLLSEGETVQDITIAIPFSMRQPQDTKLHNVSSMAFTFMPTTIADPLERMESIHKNMNYLKYSPVPVLMYFGFEFLWSWTLFVKVFTMFDGLMMNFYATKCQTILTNVPGPACEINIAGHEVESFAPFIPCGSRGGLSMGLLSYNGRIYFGAFAESGVVEGSVERICEHFVNEFNVLLEKAKSKTNQKTN